MASVLEQTQDSSTVSAARVVPRLGQKEQLLEVLVFLFLIVPSMALALLLIHRAPEQVSFPLVAVSIMLRDLGLAALIFFFLWRNGEPNSRIGWRLRGAWREVALGVALYVPFYAAMYGLERLFLQLGLTGPPAGSEAFLRPHGVGQLILAGVMVVVVAMTEETIFRGYLLLRFSALSRSMVFAVVLSSVIFSIGHGYEGSVGVATVGVMGALFAVIYLWRGSLVAPVTMHFLQDFIAIVVLSALAGQPSKATLAEAPHRKPPAAEWNVTTHAPQFAARTPAAGDRYTSCDESFTDRERLEPLVAQTADAFRHVTADAAAVRHLRSTEAQSCPPNAAARFSHGIRDGGGFGSIIGRNSFQRPKPKALELLSNVMQIYEREPS